MGPVTVITGAGRGIGAATAYRLAAAGHAVCIGYRQDAEAARHVVEEILAGGARAVATQVDTTEPAAVDRLFEVAANELGPVSGLVNNAGITGPLGRLADVAPADLRRVLEVNVVGTALCARRAVQAMSTAGGGPGGAPGGSGGAIVNVSSAAATLGSPGEYVHYAASKAAVEALTVGLAKEVAADGIRVNAVAPGIVLTGLHAANGDPDRPYRLAAQIPMGRPGEPAEIAAAVAWLLSPEASYTTGAVLRVAGGR